MFTLDTTLAEDLKKPFDQYHKKDLFESRPFGMEKVRVTRRIDGAAKTWEFSKIKRDDADVWQLTPEGGQAVDVDRPKLDDLLNKLTDLKMGALVDSTRQTGLDAPILNVGRQLRQRQVRARARSAASGASTTATARANRPPARWRPAAVDAALQALDAALVAAGQADGDPEHAARAPPPAKQ